MVPTIERRTFHPNSYPMDPVAGVGMHGIQIFRDPALSAYGVGGRIEAGRLGPVAGYLCQRAIAADNRLAAVLVRDPNADRVIVLACVEITDAEILAHLGIRATDTPPPVTAEDLATAGREALIDAARAAGIKVDGRKSTEAIRATIAEALGVEVDA